MIRGLLLATAVGFAAMSGPARAECPPDGMDADALQALKADGFAVEDAAERQALALAITDCLADPDPALRDGIAYEALTTWLRGDGLDEPTRRALLDTLTPWIAADAEAGDGFRAPFAALALSEVARTDRIAAWLDPAARDELVEAAADYLESVDDYRGFDEDADGYLILAKSDDGWCVALDRGTMRCTIYTRRPFVCREFDEGGGDCADVRADWRRIALSLQ